MLGWQMRPSFSLPPLHLLGKGISAVGMGDQQGRGRRNLESGGLESGILLRLFKASSSASSSNPVSVPHAKDFLIVLVPTVQPLSLSCRCETALHALHACFLSSSRDWGPHSSVNWRSLLTAFACAHTLQANFALTAPQQQRYL